jgi:hypothetical protein
MATPEEEEKELQRQADFMLMCNLSDTSSVMSEAGRFQDVEDKYFEQIKSKIDELNQMFHQINQKQQIHFDDIRRLFRDYGWAYADYATAKAMKEILVVIAGGAAESE